MPAKILAAAALSKRKAQKEKEVLMLIARVWLHFSVITDDSYEVHPLNNPQSLSNTQAFCKAVTLSPYYFQ